ncbi:MAG TPA: ATP-binding cassette domain-containing protein [Desulfobulbaceae bacterium]|nr:ATP-binding cassette domain-containing protein [Desulfobulbaceae bacterium]
MGRLEIHNLTFRDRGPYSLQINGGECVGLQGASGSGKSLLLRAIADLDPHGGSMRLDQMECADVPAPQWRKSVAMLPAESSWWLDTVEEHFKNFSAISKDYLAQLGFDSEVGGWQVSRLSTGEKQRLAILRMLENRPGALLLDEPTASLDAVNITNVEQLLLEYGCDNNVPLLWVSHDPDQLVRVADRCLYMHPDGKLTAYGENDGC